MSYPTTVHGRYYGTGKRKHAVARVFVRPGTGDIAINGRSLERYFPRQTLRMLVKQPFEHIQNAQYDVEANVRGGGTCAQAQAIRHGIARALLGVEGHYRTTLKKAGMLTRDARRRERKKPGQPGARKKFQYSKR